MRPSLVILLLLCACSCARPASRRAEKARASQPSADAARVLERLTRAKARLDQAIEAPKEGGQKRCPTELGLSSTKPVETLMLRTRDQRELVKNPLPVDFVSALSSDDFASVTAHLTGGAEALWNPNVATPSSPEDAALALAALDALGERRYLAELRVEAFKEPKLFRRKDAVRPEWDPGYVGGRLVVFDLSERRALCQAPIAVRGDASGASTRRNRREATRRLLQGALSARVYAALETALSSISMRLALPARVPDRDAELEPDALRRLASR